MPSQVYKHAWGRVGWKSHHIHKSVVLQGAYVLKYFCQHDAYKDVSFQRENKTILYSRKPMTEASGLRVFKCYWAFKILWMSKYLLTTDSSH